MNAEKKVSREIQKKVYKDLTNNETFTKLSSTIIMRLNTFSMFSKRRVDFKINRVNFILFYQSTGNKQCLSFPLFLWKPKQIHTERIYVVTH